MTQPQTDTELAQEVLRLADDGALRPGPWSVHGPWRNEDGYEGIILVDAEENVIAELRIDGYADELKCEAVTVFAFLAACRQAAPDLARRLRKAVEEDAYLRRELATLLATLETQRKCDLANVAELHRADAEIGRLRATLEERERELAEARAAK